MEIELHRKEERGIVREEWDEERNKKGRDEGNKGEKIKRERKKERKVGKQET
jgi:hypothetical protein